MQLTIELTDGEYKSCVAKAKNMDMELSKWAASVLCEYTGYIEPGRHLHGAASLSPRTCAMVVKQDGSDTPSA